MLVAGSIGNSDLHTLSFFECFAVFSFLMGGLLHLYALSCFRRRGYAKDLDEAELNVKSFENFIQPDIPNDLKKLYFYSLELMAFSLLPFIQMLIYCKSAFFAIFLVCVFVLIQRNAYVLARTIKRDDHKR